MTQVAFGILTDKLGHAAANGRHWATPSGQVRSVQDERVAINLEHNPYAEVGEAVYFERDRHQRLWLVAHVDDRVVPSVSVRLSPTETRSVSVPYFWSAERIGNEASGILFVGIALTSSPARVSPKPVRFLPGALDHRSAADRWDWKLERHERELLTRAAHSHLDRRRTDPLEPLVVHGEQPQQTLNQGLHGVYEATSFRHRVEVRSAHTVDVNVAKRELDVVIAPAESPTMIHEPSRTYVETYSHGCFSGCESAPERVKVNMHHVRQRTVGKAVHLDPWDEAGLVGTLRLARVADADEALALVEEGLLGVSAGFATVHDEWDSGRRNRRVKRATLDHIALTPDPAYEGATVFASRDRELAVY